MKKQISLLHLIFIIYFTVSGGAFGLEELVPKAGPGLALLLLIVTPLIFSLPIALMVAEMGSMLPLEGGYYRWVHFALGRFWGFQEGWWSWLNTFVDMAIYPVLFATYAGFLFHRLTGWSLTGWQQWFVALLVIYSSLAINLLGVRSVGRSAVFSFGIVTLTFLLFSMIGALKMQHTPWHPLIPGGQGLNKTIGLGLAIVMWNYIGWDNVSTFAGEVERPNRNYPLALMISVPLVAVLYVLPVGVGLATTHNWCDWQTGDFARIADQVVGLWLGVTMSIAIMFSNWSLFNSQLLYVSRLPFAMAEDSLLPRLIMRKHRRWGTPYVSLLTCSLIYSFFALLGFNKLVVIDILIYSIALMLEYVALISLRRRRSDLERPFKIPGGWLGLTLTTGMVVAFTVACLIFTIIGENESWKQVVITAAMLLTGPLAYWMVTKVSRSTTKKDLAAEWLHGLTHRDDQV